MGKRQLFPGGRALLALVILALCAGLASARPDVLPTTGTVGSRLSIVGDSFGSTVGKATLVDATSGATTTLKVVTWTDSEIVADVGKLPAQGFMEYRVSFTPKGGSWSRLDDTFTVAPVALTSVSTETGAPGDSVTLTGTNFGPKRGKVSLAYPNPKKPGLLYKSCKLTTWTMDPATGASTAVVVVPKLTPGEYQLLVNNKVSEASWSNPFTVTGPP
jgi:hypothetical protein